MSLALCIDFGTSSIRAVFRDNQNERHVLPIGLVTGSKSIDEASIRSEIHIDSKGKTLRYGEHAVRARSRLSSTQFYEASPKLWLLQPQDLDQSAFPGLKVTRRELLTGLLAYGIFGAKEALLHVGISVPINSLDIRIAHPVWSDGIGKRANHELLSIGFAASKMAEKGDWGEVPLSTLKSYFDPPMYVDSLHPKSDVVEPIAAALELLNRRVNVRQIVAVVDVGAGTTDIGLFYSVVTYSRSDRLIPVCSTRSVFKAGNEIDRVLLTELVKRSGVIDELRLYDVKTRIRQIKEFLFTSGFVQELGVRISLNELEAHPDIKTMAREIRACFSEAVEAESIKILVLNDQPQIEIVMAGGGGSVQFIQRVLASPLKVRDLTIPVRVAIAEAIDLLTYGASRERLAVALGGANVHYDGLKLEHEKLGAIPSLGKAKQDVTKVKSLEVVNPIPSQIISTTSSAQSYNLSLANKEKEEKAIWREQISKLARVADQGDADTQFDIAEKLRSTSTQYFKEAMDWYVRAARQGHHAAQLQLVDLLLSGTAIAADFPDAYFWLLVASKNGSRRVIDEANKVRQSLSASEAEKIQLAAKSWKPKSEKVVPDPEWRIPTRPVLAPRPESKKQGAKSPKVDPSKPVIQATTVIVNAFDELKIRELIRHSAFLKPALNTLSDFNELIKWSKKKDAFEAAFLAKYRGSSFDAAKHLRAEEQTKLDAWLTFAKRKGL